MYQAKAAGRDNFQYFTEAMNAEAHERLSLQLELRDALVTSQFVLHYQPQVDLRSGKVFAVEALVRWNHPVHGLLPPDRFIGIAEESGLIVPARRLGSAYRLPPEQGLAGCRPAADPRVRQRFGPPVPRQALDRPRQARARRERAGSEVSRARADREPDHAGHPARRSQVDARASGDSACNSPSTISAPAIRA